MPREWQCRNNKRSRRTRDHLGPTPRARSSSCEERSLGGCSLGCSACRSHSCGAGGARFLLERGRGTRRLFRGESCARGGAGRCRGHFQSVLFAGASGLFDVRGRRWGVPGEGTAGEVELGDSFGRHQHRDGGGRHCEVGGRGHQELDRSVLPLGSAWCGDLPHRGGDVSFAGVHPSAHVRRPRDVVWQPGVGQGHASEDFG